MGLFDKIKKVFTKEKNESVEKFEENPEDKTRADELIAVFKECFPAGSDEEEEEPSNTPTSASTRSYPTIAPNWMQTSC